MRPHRTLVIENRRKILRAPVVVDGNACRTLWPIRVPPKSNAPAQRQRTRRPG